MSQGPTGRRWMGKGGGGTDYKTQGGGGGRKIKAEEGGTAMGEPHAWHCWEEVTPGEGRQRNTRRDSEQGGHVGGMMMLAFKTPRLFLNLLKCLYSHCICLPKTGITLFINQRGYVHSEPPVVICTVVLIIVDIAARGQCF